MKEAEAKYLDTRTKPDIHYLGRYYPATTLRFVTTSKLTVLSHLFFCKPSKQAGITYLDYYLLPHLNRCTLQWLGNTLLMHGACDLVMMLKSGSVLRTVLAFCYDYAERPSFLPKHYSAR